MQSNQKAPDIYKTSRVMYILEEMLNYFVHILTSGAYLARITNAVGISDAVTGILSSLISFACVAQLFSLFMMNKRSVKRFVTFGFLINQLLFVLLYLTPFIPIPNGARAYVLGACLLASQLFSQVVHSPKTTWFMSLVDDKKRGIFTANKEMISLVSGMLFTFVMGAVVDRFDAQGNERGSFIFIAITLLVLCLFHTLSLVFSKEKTTSEKVVLEKVRLRELLTNPNLLKVIPVAVFWYVITYSTSPFYGTYVTKELGFSMVLISVISALGCLARALFSRPMGGFADKYSFSTMLILCFGFLALALLINTFTVPSNGKIFYTAYVVIHAFALAGINSSLINLIYDYVPSRMRVAALAFQNILAGLIGFLATVICSRLVAYIQSHGNQFLGINVYAQQILNAIGFVISLLAILYLCTVVKKIRRVTVDDTMPE